MAQIKYIKNKKADDEKAAPKTAKPTANTKAKVTKPAPAEKKTGAGVTKTKKAPKATTNGTAAPKARGRPKKMKEDATETDGETTETKTKAAAKPKGKLYPVASGHYAVALLVAASRGDHGAKVRVV